MSHASLKIEICAIKSTMESTDFEKTISISRKFTTYDADELMAVEDMIMGCNLRFSLFVQQVGSCGTN